MGLFRVFSLWFLLYQSGGNYSDKSMLLISWKIGNLGLDTRFSSEKQIPFGDDNQKSNSDPGRLSVFQVAKRLPQGSVGRGDGRRACE